jgi:hypothetical protein
MLGHANIDFNISLDYTLARTRGEVTHASKALHVRPQKEAKLGRRHRVEAFIVDKRYTFIAENIEASAGKAAEVVLEVCCENRKI